MRWKACTGRSSSRPIWAGYLVVLVAMLTIAGQGSFHAPPRYDGAGYAVLARSLAEGSGYRAIDHPDRPRHAHFPPGYPAFLALVWSVTGPSATAAHVASSLCAVGATLAAWLWFRRLYPRDVALLLGLALAVNGAWSRTGSGIQSEPLYELLGQVAILLAWEVARCPCQLISLLPEGEGAAQRRMRIDRRGLRLPSPGLRPPSPRGRGFAGGTSDKVKCLALGVFLAACFLTRQIAVGLALAVMLDLAIRQRARAALVVAATTAILIAPWLVWLVIVGASERTQASLLLAGSSGLVARLVSQLSFYIQRIPDQITGPFVEIATVIRQSPGAAVVANLWALTASALVIGGWIMALRRPRFRLAGLIPLLTLGLLLLWPYTEAGRFLIPLIPCLLIGAVEGTSGLLRAIVRSLRLTITRRRTRLVVAALLLAVSLPYAGYSLLKVHLRPPDDADRAFDMACAWLAEHGDRPGPVLTRHPGEVFLATGRQALEVATAERPGEADASSDAIAEMIARYNVAYLLIDRDRYLMAHESPLERFVRERPERFRRVSPGHPERPAVDLYEVVEPAELPGSPHGD